MGQDLHPSGIADPPSGTVAVGDSLVFNADTLAVTIA